MKLKELNDAIATACNVRPNVVTAIQTETFKQLKAALDKGEKIVIPEFGMFVSREVAGEEGAPGKKTFRFRARSGEGGKKEGKEKGGRKTKKAAGAEAPAAKDDEE